MRTWNIDQALDHRVVLRYSNIESVWDEFNLVGKTKSINERNISRFSKTKASLP